jgi:hypothetical protein
LFINIILNRFQCIEIEFIDFQYFQIIEILNKFEEAVNAFKTVNNILFLCSQITFNQSIDNFSILGNIWTKLSNKVGVNSNDNNLLKLLFLSIEGILIIFWKPWSWSFLNYLIESILLMIWFHNELQNQNFSIEKNYRK